MGKVSALTGCRRASSSRSGAWLLPGSATSRTPLPATARSTCVAPAAQNCRGRVLVPMCDPWSARYHGQEPPHALESSGRPTDRSRSWNRTSIRTQPSSSWAVAGSISTRWGSSSRAPARQGAGCPGESAPTGCARGYRRSATRLEPRPPQGARREPWSPTASAPIRSQRQALQL
jgi:hypothetical protein